MSRMVDHVLGPGVPALLEADRQHGLTLALGARPRGAAELAADLHLDPRATALVLAGLAALGRCRRDPAGTWSADPLPDWPWSGLDAFLRSGRLATDLDQAATRDHLYATAVVDLAARSAHLARALAARLPAAGEILDIGAGAGPWSLAMALHAAESRVTALDRPEVLPRFVEAAARAGLSERVEGLPGRFTDPLPAGRWDRVVLANILHLLPAPEAEALVVRATRALRPQGDLVIVDCLPRADGLDDLTVATYALHLGMRTLRGAVHSTADLRRWCRRAGRGRTRLLRLPGEPGVGALWARAAER